MFSAAKTCQNEGSHSAIIISLMLVVWTPGFSWCCHWCLFFVQKKSPRSLQRRKTIRTTQFQWAASTNIL